MNKRTRALKFILILILVVPISSFAEGLLLPGWPQGPWQVPNPNFIGPGPDGTIGYGGPNTSPFTNVPSDGASLKPSYPIAGAGGAAAGGAAAAGTESAGAAAGAATGEAAAGGAFIPVVVVGSVVLAATAVGLGLAAEAIDYYTEHVLSQPALSQEEGDRFAYCWREACSGNGESSNPAPRCSPDWEPLEDFRDEVLQRYADCIRRTRDSGNSNIQN